MSEAAPAEAKAPEAPAPRMTAAVRWIIALNIAVFFAQLTLLAPEDVQLALGFQSKDVGHQWWTAVTYLFVHRGAAQLALSLLALMMFGPRLEWAWSAGEFTRYYIVCGLGGWIAHLAFVPGDTVLLGATSSVLGLMLAYGTRWPDAPMALLGVVPMSARWLAALLGTASVLTGIAAGGETGVAYLAHLGGLAAGWLYLRMAATVNLTRLKESVSPVQDEPDEDAPPRAFPRSLPRSRNREKPDDIVAQSNAAVAERATTPPPTAPRPNAKDLDRLLDKISEQGLESLTKDERRLLEEESKRRREP